MKMTVWVDNELIWYKIFLDNYYIINNYKWNKEMPEIDIIENYLICYVAIYNVFESYIDLLLKELKISLIKKNWDFKWIYTKVNDINNWLKIKIESDIKKIKVMRNWILHLNQIKFDLSKIEQKGKMEIICNDNLNFDIKTLTKNHNEIIKIINTIWTVFLIEYKKKSNMTVLPKYIDIFELNKFIWVIDDMQIKKLLNNKWLNLPNF